MANKIKLTHIISIFFILTAVHLILLKARIYQGKTWVDIPLHIVAGVFFGLIFLWWIGKSGKFGVKSYKFVVLGLILFGLALGLLWEGFEVVLWKFFPNVGNYFEIKRAPLSDFFSDLALGSLGSLVWLAFVKPDRRK